MQIPISTQAEYDALIKSRKHTGHEIVIQNCNDFIRVNTDVTVGKNGRCYANGDNTITAKENGIVTAEGKTKVIGQDTANIITKGNCKVTLTDSAFGNCYENCQITLKNTSRVSADGHCTVHAYDEASVSVSGSSKVYTYQNVTAKGSDVTTIMAKDNCIVYATDKCTVKAADNCLIVANKDANIIAKDNCLLMSNDNPKVQMHDQCEQIKLGELNDKNIITTLKQMAQSKGTVERPYVALQILKDSLPPTRKEAVDRRLNTMGLKDQVSTKNYLYSLIEAEPAQKNQATAQNMERQLETARKAGYVQGVCECVKAVGQEHNMGKKLMSEMQVTKDMAKKFANPETYKELEKGIFAQKEQKLEQTRGVRR
jgi:hypothetical protein